MEAVKEKVKKVFGISKVAIAYVAEKDIDAIDQVVNEKLKPQLSQAKTFKVEQNERTKNSVKIAGYCQGNRRARA